MAETTTMLVIDLIGAALGACLGLWTYQRYIGPFMRRLDDRIADRLHIPKDQR